jgi:hypothetical protein
MDIEYGRHFRDMMQERGIVQKWVDSCITAPDKTEEHSDGTSHFIKRITENNDRWLRVIINQQITPSRGVNLFFDRRLRRKHES